MRVEAAATLSATRCPFRVGRKNVGVATIIMTTNRAAARRRQHVARGVKSLGLQPSLLDAARSLHVTWVRTYVAPSCHIAQPGSESVASSVGETPWADVRVAVVSCVAITFHLRIAVAQSARLASKSGVRGGKRVRQHDSLSRSLASAPSRLGGCLRDRGSGAGDS